MPSQIKRSKKGPFKGVRVYLAKLDLLAANSDLGKEWSIQCHAALNGEASSEVRKIASLDVRRVYGAFFTGSTLSSRLLSRMGSITSSNFYYDPTCGMGDLLLAAAKRLPLGQSLTHTLKLWGEQIAGTDLHSEFIRGAKTRLILLAKQRHGASPTVKVPRTGLFPWIKVGDGMRQKAFFDRATHLLMNPPFGMVQAGENYKWTSGRTTEAAIFIINALERTGPGTEILAILPEVLRAGSFSQHWRQRVGELAEIHLIEPYGIFDESADIDVFLLRLVRRKVDEENGRKSWPVRRKTVSSTIADHFEVHVGRVVPHRDKVKGPEHPYIHARSVPPWKTVRKFSEKLKHEGLPYKTPFVVIRRTSRPGHPFRATATIIAGGKPVAVENHLIVCEPKDNTLRSCRKLMEHLKSEGVNEFLNARIRCRHLTVGAIKEIPW